MAKTKKDKKKPDPVMTTASTEKEGNSSDVTKSAVKPDLAGFVFKKTGAGDQEACSDVAEGSSGDKVVCSDVVKNSAGDKGAASVAAKGISGDQETSVAAISGSKNQKAASSEAKGASGDSKASSDGLKGGFGVEEVTSDLESPEPREENVFEKTSCDASDPEQEGAKDEGWLIYRII